MSSEYPERRPYTNGTPRTGYSGKPKTRTPNPPSEALAILNAQVGYDVPRNARTPNGGRLPAIEDGSQDVPVTDPTLMLDGARTSTQVMKKAKLEDPFEHRDNEYHNCQQSALNAELRHAVEKFLEDWKKKLQQLKMILNHYPPDAKEMAFTTADAIKAYGEAYKCTEDLSVPIEKLIEDFHLTCSAEEIEEVAAVTAIPLDNIQRTMNALLTSNLLLAPLDQYAVSLEVFDRIAKPEESMKNEMDAEGKPVGPIRPSTTAVVLHERFHYNPVEYSERELSKMERPLLKMEERVVAAKGRKELAIENLNPADALRNLHAQVDFSNDLLLMNKSRMLLVAMHTEDVREFRAEVVRVIENAKRAADMLRKRVEDLLPRVRQDLTQVNDDADETRQQLRQLEDEEREAMEDMARGMKTFEQKELDLWSQMAEIMNQLQKTAVEKAQYCQEQMGQREQRSKVYTTATELLNAQEAHILRLEVTEDVLRRWQLCGEMYDKYVGAFEPKLLKRLAQLEEDDEDLSNRESQDYVRRYEMFTYGAEEARAKRVVQADRMRLQQRASRLDQDVAHETLDPANERHAKRIDEAEKELEEVLAYVEYIHNIEHDRREEVEPILRKVISYNKNMYMNGDQIQQEEAKKIEAQRTADTTTAAEDASQAPSFSPSTKITKSADGRAVAVASGEMPATMQHPQVTARLVGLAHEEAYTEKHRQLNEEELMAGEAKLSNIKKSKNELIELGVKYKNTDYVQAIAAERRRGNAHETHSQLHSQRLIHVLHTDPPPPSFSHSRGDLRITCLPPGQGSSVLFNERNSSNRNKKEKRREENEGGSALKYKNNNNKEQKLRESEIHNRERMEKIFLSETNIGEKQQQQKNNNNIDEKSIKLKQTTTTTTTKKKQSETAYKREQQESKRSQSESVHVCIEKEPRSGTGEEIDVLIFSFFWRKTKKQQQHNINSIDAPLIHAPPHTHSFYFSSSLFACFVCNTDL
eukprot:gene2181-1349_t